MAATYITFGNVITNKYGKPVLPVNTVKNGEEVTYYLMWFRNCFFQVCATPEGEWDYGSSDEVAPFARKDLPIMKAFAIEALTKMGSNAYSDLRFSLNCEKQYQLVDYIRLVIKSL